MKPPFTKLQQQQTEETIGQLQQQAELKTTTREFQSVEEVIRADVAQTAVPEAVKSRLAESVSKEPGQPQPRSWWRRFLP